MLYEFPLLKNGNELKKNLVITNEVKQSHRGRRKSKETAALAGSFAVTELFKGLFFLWVLWNLGGHTNQAPTIL
ncbi:MAG: hypothetical protein DRQ51_08630 [Gammaproteobacteria bacterium]|nr:MAG: hypothetical protein DRQ51_08630 [Gammaproteobacteria bacterium]